MQHNSGKESEKTFHLSVLPVFPAEELPSSTSPTVEKRVRTGGRRERQGGGLRTFPRLLDVPGQQRAQVRSGLVVHSPHGPLLPPRGLVLLLRPGARGVRGRHGLRQGARRQDSHQHAQAQATVHGCGEQREGDVNGKVGPPRALAEGRAPRGTEKGAQSKRAGLRTRQAGASTREP